MATGDTSEATGDRGQGTGDRGQGSGDRGQETGDRRQGTGDGGGVRRPEARQAEFLGGAGGSTVRRRDEHPEAAAGHFRQNIPKTP